MASLPPLTEELKFINPYLQRAQETRKREPVISYYCNYYAAKLAIEKGTKSKDSKMFLAKLLDALEQEKKAMSDNDAVTNDMAGQAYIENFSLKVFTMADNEDRAGKATKNTAKTFVAASAYMELLKIFGDTNPEFEDKIKYAKWKGIDIYKAFKEGRTPVPGPPGGEAEENNQDIPGIDQLPPAQTAPDPAPGPTTGPTVLPPSSENSSFPSFPLAPTKDHNNSVPNVQDLVSSFEQIDIGKQVTPPAPPPLPPKVNDYARNSDNNIFDNQFNQPPPPAASNFTPSPSTNFYDMHQNYQQPPPPPQPQPPSNLPHTGFTNDYVQPHQYQSLPPQSHNSFFSSPSPPPPQVPPQNYIQTVNPPQPSFSAPVPSQPSHQNCSISQPISQPPLEIDPTTAEKVQKYCKFASSALNYNDVKTAVNYMNMALEALKPFNK